MGALAAAILVVATPGSVFLAGAVAALFGALLVVRLPRPGGWTTIHAAALDEPTPVTGPVPASLVLISPAIGISRAAALAGWQKRLSALPGMGARAWLVKAGSPPPSVPGGAKAVDEAWATPASRRPASHQSGRGSLISSASWAPHLSA